MTLRALCTLLLVCAAAAQSAAGDGSFEDVPAGPLTDATTALGRFEAAPGHAEITRRFARSGAQCLRLLGGTDRTLTWTRRSPEAARLSFWAERWTRRTPFAFHVDGRAAGGEWRELYDGTAELRVGRAFLSRVVIRVPEGTRKLRLRSTAPADTGVLIDDVALTASRPMRLRGARHARWVAPVLIGGGEQTVAEVVIDTAGSTSPLVLTGCAVRIPEAVRLDDIASVSVLADGERFGAAVEPRREPTFTGRHELDPDGTRLRIVLRLADGASLDRRIGALCTRLSFASRATANVAAPRDPTQRVGVLVRAAGQDGVHTYRIPGLATTNAGTLIAVYDCRRRGAGDLPGDIDVGMSRSVDGGRTWEPMRVIMDMGDDPKWRYDGIGDPAVLVDRRRGTVWVAATWSHGDRSWNGSGPGLAPEQTGQLMLTRSDDDGLTWSEPINITRQVKDPAWRFVLQGPGKGITLGDGTLVFAAQFRGADDSPARGKPFSTLISSADGGSTWTIGSGCRIDTTEAQVVELGDGRLMLNCRDNRGGARSVYTTRDLGRTWTEHSTSRRALPEPVCMASLIRIEREAGRPPLLLFSNPATTSSRRDMTLKVSADAGETWPDRWHHLYDQRPCFGYSCLTRIDATRVGVLYEGRGELRFVRFSIPELIGR